MLDQRKHWDKIGNNYDSEIFDVYQSDRNKTLLRYLNKHKDIAKVAIDFGCGTGKALPYLVPRFKHVVAVDISDNLLTTAQGRNLKGITFKQADLADTSLKLPKADFAFCCNVIMLPEVEKNNLIFKNIWKTLRKNSYAVIVIPSLESALYATWRMTQWYKRDSVKVHNIPAADFHYFKGDKREIVQGVIHIDNVPTKHYMREELNVLLSEVGFDVKHIEKIEYDWTTEFDEPPVWMKDPYPWDWLIECYKK